MPTQANHCKERMGRDYMAYRLEQVKSQVYSHYCEKGVRDV